MDKLNCNVRKSPRNKATEPAYKGKADIVVLNDDDDDFVTQVAKKVTAQPGVKNVQSSSTSSSDDFVTPKPKDSSGKKLVLSNKRPSKLAKKFREELPIFIPYSFPYLRKAKELKELILSTEYNEAHGRLV